MQKYLVGGAVRDSLLKLPIKEKDWVITGSTPQEMLNIGYEQVGKDFPVFLHPKNHEEYALARTERKSGQGYTGFTCYASPVISIEEDLYRRDLTINAMAYDMHGNLLDPYNGQRDIKLRLLRHVSNAFYEDPLRVLRVARFAAKLKKLRFTIAPETLLLMQKMTQELQSLSPERIWMETKKALITDSPHIYFQVLNQCGALKRLFPELYILFKKTTNTNQQNNAIAYSIGDQVMKTLSNIAYISNSLSVRFSILCCHLGKKNNPQKESDSNYQISKISPINTLCNRLKIPRNIFKFAKTCALYHDYLTNFTILSPKNLMTVFMAFNCWKFPNHIEKIIYINKSNSLDNKNLNYLYSQEQFLRAAFKITKYIKTNDIIENGFTGSDISKELYSRRLNVLTKWIKKPIFNK